VTLSCFPTHRRKENLDLAVDSGPSPLALPLAPPLRLCVVVGFGFDPAFGGAVDARSALPEGSAGLEPFPAYSMTGRLPDPCSPSSPSALTRVAFGEA
jgi:hypothetical protein